MSKAVPSGHPRGPLRSRPRDRRGGPCYFGPHHVAAPATGNATTRDLQIVVRPFAGFSPANSHPECRSTPGHLSDRAVLQYDGVDQVTSELHAHTPLWSCPRCLATGVRYVPLISDTTHWWTVVARAWGEAVRLLSARWDRRVVVSQWTCLGPTGWLTNTAAVTL